MKQYFFHIADDEVEIRDNEGVFLPEGEDIAEFCRKLILSVASEDNWAGDSAITHTVTVADANGNEVLTVPVGDALSEAPEARLVHIAPREADRNTTPAPRSDFH